MCEVVLIYLTTVHAIDECRLCWVQIKSDKVELETITEQLTFVKFASFVSFVFYL